MSYLDLDLGSSRPRRKNRGGHVSSVLSIPKKKIGWMPLLPLASTHSVCRAWSPAVSRDYIIR